MSEQEMIQENQLFLIKSCLKQNECMAWKFFGTNNKKNPQLGWQVGKCDTWWTASVRYVSKFKSGISSSCKDYQDMYKGDKRKESMWIHHFVILQLFHPKLLKIESAEFLHNNHSFLFISSPPTTSNFIKISLKNLPCIIGCGWGEMLVIKSGVA
jgi:hypothetical protein